MFKGLRFSLAQLTISLLKNLKLFQPAAIAILIAHKYFHTVFLQQDFH
jgi:hypothetical protein